MIYRTPLSHQVDAWQSNGYGAVCTALVPVAPDEIRKVELSWQFVPGGLGGQLQRLASLACYVL